MAIEQINRYSQNGEEIIIQKYFGDYVGVFADFGANEGITFSNTYLLSLYNWKGLLCEPSAEAFKRLQFNYRGNPNVCLFNCAVTGNYEGVVKFWESGPHIGNGDIALLSTVNIDELERWKGSNNTFTETNVPAIPVNRILEESGFPVIDFFSIDIEGSELDVISQIDFEKYKTKMICVEFNGKHQEKYDAIILPFGFNLIHKNAENLIYTK